MSDIANTEASALPVPELRATEARPDPIIRITAPETYFDITTVLALILSLGLVAAAILMGNTKANFLDIASVLMVVLGTITVTIISYTGREIQTGWPIIRGAISRTVYNPTLVARELLDIALLARKRGLLSLGTHTDELIKNPFLADAVQMVTDGMTSVEIDRLIHQDMDVTLDGYRKAAGMLRRASEIAPAMGLIGTLIGLVQMLASLDDPSVIGPAMALALLTTFYGAIMGSVILAPLAAKLERNANEDMLVKSLIHATMLSILAQENPRKLEMELNSLLPPDLRIHYFDI